MIWTGFDWFWLICVHQRSIFFPVQALSFEAWVGFGQVQSTGKDIAFDGCVDISFQPSQLQMTSKCLLCHFCCWTTIRTYIDGQSIRNQFGSQNVPEVLTWLSYVFKGFMRNASLQSKFKKFWCKDTCGWSSFFVSKHQWWKAFSNFQSDQPTRFSSRFFGVQKCCVPK